MAIDPKLVSITPASELPTGNPTNAGQFFFFEGNQMKKAPMTDIYDKVKTAYLGIATTTTTPPATGAYWYKVTTAGTYMGVTVTDAELYANIVYLNVTNGVISKELNAKDAQSLGTITPESVIPEDGNVWAFASPGKYPNAGNITVEAGKFAILSRIGTTWSKVEVSMPKGWTKETLFSFKKLQSENILAVNCTIANENEGLNVTLNEGGLPFSSQLIANNFYSNNETGIGFFFVLSERSYQKIVFKQKSLMGGGSYPDIGLGVSFVSANVFDFKWSAGAYLVTNPNNEHFGKIIIVASNGWNSIKSFYSENALPNYEVGDVIDFAFERYLHDYIVTAKNLSKGNEISLRISPKNNFSEYIPFNNSNPCINVASGNFLVYSWEYGWTLDRQADLFIAGDSITLGQSAVVEPLRWAANVGVKENNIISGGGADYLNSLKSRLQEIYVLKPKRVLIMLGGNDILLGTPTQQWKDDLDWIVYHLQLQGIPVVLCYPSARAGAGELINYINSSTWLQNVPKIDFNTPTAEGGNPEVLKTEYDSGDNLHPNNAGHAKMAEVANAWLNANPL